MNVAIPDAIVTGYEPQVDRLDLPDLDDRHVLAAAIRSGATSIVTANLADFPRDVLARYGMSRSPPTSSSSGWSIRISTPSSRWLTGRRPTCAIRR
jgi:hypothetical protein